MAKKSKAPARATAILSGPQVYSMMLDIASRAVTNRVDVRSLARIATAIAKKESTWNANALNPDGNAAGLMQIRASTQKLIEKLLGIPIDVNRAKIFDAKYNGMLGSNLLAHEYNNYKDWSTAIRVYNQGTKNRNNAAAKSYAASVMSIHNQIPFNDFERTLAYGG
jgi:soluble lytic murein transglycosylase-like protein